MKRALICGISGQDGAYLIGNPHFELMRHDLNFPLFVEVDEIYNLACPAVLVTIVHYIFKICKELK